MVDACSLPGECVHFMAFGAFGRKIPFDMIGFCGGNIILLVAIKTFHAQRLEPQQRCRGMARLTIGRGMCSQQRKAAELMDFGNVLDNPRLRCVAAFAIGAQGLVVHILMTGHTFVSGFVEHERFMALPATHRLMLTREREIRRIVGKTVSALYHGPAFGGMAIAAIQRQRITVRRLPGQL